VSMSATRLMHTAIFTVNSPSVMGEGKIVLAGCGSRRMPPLPCRVHTCGASFRFMLSPSDTAPDASRVHGSLDRLARGLDSRAMLAALVLLGAVLRIYQYVADRSL